MDQGARGAGAFGPLKFVGIWALENRGPLLQRSQWGQGKSPQLVAANTMLLRGGGGASASIFWIY